MRRILWVVVVLALGIGAVWWQASLRSRRHATRSKVPGIVLLCIDTLRADAVDADGTSDGLPSLRAFGRSATRFTSVISAASWTSPSMATILTGIGPLAHGVSDINGNTPLASSIPTLATRLKRDGWSTVAITAGGWVSAPNGYARGFDRFETDFDTRDVPAALVQWERDRPTDRPFFLFLHTYAAHDPYGEKRPLYESRCEDRTAEAETIANGLRDGTIHQNLGRYVVSMMGEPCLRAAIAHKIGKPAAARLWISECRPWLDGAWRTDPDGPSAVQALRQIYRRSLKYVDERIAEVLDAVAKLPPDTVVVILGDHGEAFGEHRAVHHSRFLDEELVHVPMFVRAPGFAKGTVVERTFGLVDVTPTLLGLAGIPVEAPIEGRALSDQATESRPITSFAIPGATGPVTPEHSIQRAAVRDDDWTWIGDYSTRTGIWALERWFRRREDPLERSPLEAPPASTLTPAFVAARTAAREFIAGPP